MRASSQKQTFPLVELLCVEMAAVLRFSIANLFEDLESARHRYLSPSLGLAYVLASASGRCDGVSMKTRLPVRWYFPGRTRRRLVLRMPARFSKPLALEHSSRPEVVKPRLARFEARCDRMAGRVEVL